MTVSPTAGPAGASLIARTTVQQIDRSGIGPALSPPALPDYKPR